MNNPRTLRRGAPRSGAASGLSLLFLVILASSATAQELTVDRWLVGAANVDAGSSPLPALGPDRFPERNTEVGPVTWRLVREDGQTRFEFASEDRQSTLAHAYVKAPTDLDVRLTLDFEPCLEAGAWLNGQRVASMDSDVRLANGWNTLLVVLSGEAGCARSVAASISRALAPGDPDYEGPGIGQVRVQASRPPGVGPNFPNGSIAVSTPRIVGLRWGAGADDLEAALTYDLTAWGRPPLGDAGPSNESSDGPASDLSGEWELTVYGPSGIRRVRASLEMDPDGTLNGELRENTDVRRQQFGGLAAFEGRIRDGRASGYTVRWTIRTDLSDRAVELEFNGTLEGPRMTGTIDVRSSDGALRNFESRFDAERLSGAASAGGAGPELPTAEERLAQDAEAATDTLGPTDPDRLRPRLAAQLRGAPVPQDAAPGNATAEVRIAGERFVAATGELEPGTPQVFQAALPFRKLRDAALDEDGVRAEIRWRDGEQEVEGPADAASVLRALHGAIELTGFAGGAERQAEFRIPETLAGFTLRGGDGTWSVDGQPTDGGILCSPCERGRRLVVGFRGPEGTSPMVEIVERGFLDAAPDQAVDWLEALSGDNRRYLERAGNR